MGADLNLYFVFFFFCCSHLGSGYVNMSNPENAVKVLNRLNNPLMEAIGRHDQNDQLKRAEKLCRAVQLVAFR